MASPLEGQLAGRIALVTGAANGIGRASALRLAREGADLVVVDREGDSLQGVAREIETVGRQVLAITADWTDAKAVSDTFAALRKRFGRIDILFNNVGQSARERASEFHASEEATWRFVIEVSLVATMRATRLAVEEMRARRSGRIVNNGSDWSVVAGTDAFPYIMSKGAVAMMTKSMALDYARENIRVNAVCPGDTLVDRWMDASRGYFEKSDPVSMEQAMREASAYIPMGRFGKPEEIARAVLFLASDDASFITGHLLLVDGGNTAQ